MGRRCGGVGSRGLPGRIFSRPLAHRVGLTLAQHAVDGKTNASPVVLDVPRNEAVVAGVTSLAPEEADAARWLALVRGQGHSEHQWHGMRDVPLDEEQFQVRCGNSPQGMAALRHTVMGLMRWAG